MNAPSGKSGWESEQEAFLKEIAPESHFHWVIDGLSDVYFFAKNQKGETLFCSSNLPFNHGMTEISEMIGKTDHDLTPGPLAEKYLRDDAEIYRTGAPLPPQIEICLDHVGLPNWYRTCKYPIKNRDGKVIGVMGTFQPAAPDATGDPIRFRLEPAVRKLEADLQEFPGISRLAAACHLSVRQFQRVYKQTYNTPAKDYWMKLRIRSACERIRKGTAPLAAISADLGFYDQSSFTRHFKKHTGKTPRAYALENVTSSSA